MYYCENCSLLMEENVCQNCGAKKLREPEGEDFCCFANLYSSQAKLLQANLQAQGIEVALIASSGRVSFLDCTSAYYKVFVKYRDFDAAREIYSLIISK